jgi:hypothetical protein
VKDPWIALGLSTYVTLAEVIFTMHTPSLAGPTSSTVKVVMLDFTDTVAWLPSEMEGIRTRVSKIEYLVN